MPVIAAAFLLVPVLEIVVAVLVARWIGVWPMLGTLLLVSLAGAVVLRFASRRAYRAVREQVDAGRMPAREVADGAMTLVGGFLLLVPGFVTGLIGLLLVLPPTRALARMGFTAWAARRIAVVGVVRGVGGMRGPVYGPAGSPAPGSAPGRGVVVEGEVVDPDQGPQPPPAVPPSA